MNSSERLEHAVLLMRAYANLAVLDLAMGRDADDDWVRQLRATRRLVDSMLLMRGLAQSSTYFF